MMEILKQKMFQKISDMLYLPNTEINQRQQQQQSRIDKITNFNIQYQQRTRIS